MRFVVLGVLALVIVAIAVFTTFLQPPRETPKIAPPTLLSDDGEYAATRLRGTRSLAPNSDGPPRLAAEVEAHDASLTPEAAPSTQSAVAELNELTKSCTTVGLDPNHTLRALLALVQTAKPDPKSVRAPGLPGVLEYSLTGLVPGTEGKFWLREPGPNGERFLDLYLDSKLDQPFWLDNVPREFGNVCATVKLDSNGQPLHYSLRSYLEIDFNLASKSGIVASEQNEWIGIGYRMMETGEVSSWLMGSGLQEKTANPNPLIGPPQLSDEIKELLLAQLKAFQASIQSEK